MGLQTYGSAPHFEA